MEDNIIIVPGAGCCPMPEPSVPMKIATKCPCRSLITFPRTEDSSGSSVTPAARSAVTGNARFYIATTQTRAIGAPVPLPGWCEQIHSASAEC